LLHASPGRCTRGFLGAESQPLAPDRTAFAQGPFAPEALPSFHATTGPCADPSASHPLSAIALWEMSWPLAPSTAGRRDLPALGLPFPSWSATSSTPAVRRVLLTSSSPTTSAFTLAIQARLPASGSTNGFTWGYPFRRGRHSLMLWPSRLLAPLAVRHCDAAPEGFYVRAFRRFVTSSTVEYATRPTGRLPGLVLPQIGIGGSVTAPPLPHHRTYGSVYGGSVG
jgi:hypothetical protein